MMQSSLFSGVAKLALTVLIFLSFLQAVTARADFINGDQLRLYCTSKNPNDEAVCFVYIAGAVDAFTTIDLMGEKASGTKRQFCLPDGISPDQLKDTTMTWLARPEANLDLAATLLIWGQSRKLVAVDRRPLISRS
jgi:hypothetical protein